jgi:integrase
MSPLRRLSIHEAMDTLPCCQDHTSIEGLAPLKRCFPESWHEIIHSQCWDEVRPETTLGRYLEEGAGRLLAPRSARDQSIKKKRRSACRISEAFGAQVIAEIGEGRLRRMRDWYEAEHGEAMSAALIQADMRLLRQAVFRAQEVLGDVRVRARWTPTRRRAGKKPKERPGVTLREVRRLLAVSEPNLAAGIALIVGCGLLKGELLALRAGSMPMPEQAVLVQHRGVRGWGQSPASRALRVPFWAWQFVQRAWPGLARMPREAMLFPSPRDPETPWDNIGRAIHRAAVAAGLQADGAADPRWTPTGLRRLFQALAREAGVARAVVRGTVVRRPENGLLASELSWSLAESDKLARGWVYLLRPPGWVEGTQHHVPRRAPSGVRPDEPEWPNRSVAGWLEQREPRQRLPWGCDEVPGVPARATALVKADREAMLEQPREQHAREVETTRRQAEAEDAFAAGALAGGVAGVLLGRKLREWGG